MINESKSGRPLARLKISQEPNCRPVAFLGATQRLAIGGTRDVYLWDFSRIRTSLQELGLPWDVPVEDTARVNGTASMTPVASSDPNTEPKPIVLTIDEGPLPQIVAAGKRQAKASQLSTEARHLASLSRYVDATRIYTEAVDTAPNDAEILNNFAWMLATQPERNDEDLTLAVGMSLKTVGLVPGNHNYWNTLGVCQYRSQLFHESIVSLNRSEALMLGTSLAYNGYFLAMAHWQLGEMEEAAQWEQHVCRRQIQQI